MRSRRTPKQTPAARAGTRVPPAPPPAPDPEIPGLPPAPADLLGKHRNTDFTPEEDEEHVAFVLRLRLRGANMRQITAACLRQYGFARVRTENLLRQGLDALGRDWDQTRKTSKAEQSARLRQVLFDLHAEVQAKPDPKNPKRHASLTALYGAIVRCEELLSEVEGTREPVTVNVNQTITQAAVTVIANMTPERTQALLDRARERRALAEAARAMNLTPTGT